VIKVLERVVEQLITRKIQISEMPFDFKPGREITDAIFIVRQMEEKDLAANKLMYLAFGDLDKAFDLVPRLVCIVQAKCPGVASHAGEVNVH
jgi:hypothetical protein